MSKHRKPASRAALLKASKETGKGGGLTLAGAQLMGRGLNPEMSEFLVRDIVEYNATRIFHAPLVWPDGNASSWERIQGSTPEYSGTLTGSLKHYLEKGSEQRQFAKDPGLRETVAGVEKRKGRDATYLVVEERSTISDCRMERGECWQGPDRGRDGVAIIKTSEGEWPQFSEKVARDTALLAAMRTMTKARHPFELHARSILYITDRGEPAHPFGMEVNISYGGARAISPIPDAAVAKWANELGDRTERLQQACVDPAVNELLDAIRLDEAKDEEYFRLWYLRLWQALVDVGLNCNVQAVRDHLKTQQPQDRWKCLTKHRTAIAHWETGRVDYKKVADLHCFAVEVADYIDGVTLVSPGNRP